jgi:hypothetical protein
MPASPARPDYSQIEWLIHFPVNCRVSWHGGSANDDQESGDRRVLLSLVVTAAPVRAETPATPSGGTAAPATLRASVDRAIASAAVAPGPSEVQASRPGSKLPPQFASASTSGQASMGRGGGKTMMVVGILGTVAGLAGTYFVIKEMKKTTDAATRAQ